MMLARALLVAIVACAAQLAAAHEIRPAYLQIREIAPSVYDVLWKTPARGDMRLALNVILPPHCHTAGEPRMMPSEGAAIQRWRSTCDGGLPGHEIAIENLDAGLTDVVLHFEPLSGPPKSLRLTGAAPAAVIPARQSLWQVAGAYFPLGVEHILLGFDHLLFVLCLLLLVRGFARLVGAITAFTIAHTIALACTTLGWARLSTAPVEACIALSIAFIAAEIVKVRRGLFGLTQAQPWLACVGFGLLHGLGFASALREIGLPDGAVPLALLFFNLGVETGQILFICIVLAWLMFWRRFAGPAFAWAERAPPYIAGVVASYWFIERTARIFS